MAEAEPLPNFEITVRWIITGRVQGVSFRYFTQRAAQALGLRGWVKNLPDGSVEARVTGPRSRVEELRQQVEQGPRLALVDGVAEEFVDPGDTDTRNGDFEIRF
ncbi:MAG: acylphosphatase [Thermoanaerobaculia bacterium]